MQLGDARKLDQRTQEALRQRAVLLVENGATHVEAALAVGVHRGTISRWYGAFQRNGASGIEKGKRGRRVGDQLILTKVEARPDAIAFRAVDGAGGAGADPQEIRQEPRPVDDAALFEAVGFFRAETFDAGDAARSAKDRGLAGAGLSVNRGAGKARQGGDLLER